MEALPRNGLRPAESERRATGILRNHAPGICRGRNPPFPRKKYEQQRPFPFPRSGALLQAPSSSAQKGLLFQPLPRLPPVATQSLETAQGMRSACAFPPASDVSLTLLFPAAPPSPGPVLFLLPPADEQQIRYLWCTPPGTTGRGIQATFRDNCGLRWRDS